MNGKNQIWNLFFSAISALTFSAAATAASSGSVYVPELDRKVHYQVDTNTKEYSIDFRDLVDVSLKAKLEKLGKWSCKEWKDLLVADRHKTKLPASFYQDQPTRFRLQVMKLNMQAVSQAVSNDLKANLTNVSEFGTSKINIGFVWKDDSLVMMAGPETEAAIEQEINDKLTSPADRQTINTVGTADFSSTYPVLGCDILAGNVSLKLNFQFTQYGKFHSIVNIRPGDLVDTSQHVQTQVTSLHSHPSNVIDLGNAEVINAAGLLAFEMKRQGFDSSSIATGLFSKLYFKIFEAGAKRPTVLSVQQSEEIIKSMVETKYVPEDVDVVQDLKVIQESL